jgi:hypothetical protein
MFCDLFTGEALWNQFSTHYRAGKLLISAQSVLIPGYQRHTNAGTGQESNRSSSGQWEIFMASLPCKIDVGNPVLRCR